MATYAFKQYIKFQRPIRRGRPPLRVEQADSTVIAYAYDANGNMTRYTTPRPADNGFSYNKVSKPASFVSPLGSTTSYRYNQECQLIDVTLPSGRKIANTYEHGLLTRTTSPEGTIDFSYDCATVSSLPESRWTSVKTG